MRRPSGPSIFTSILHIERDSTSVNLSSLTEGSIVLADEKITSYNANSNAVVGEIYAPTGFNGVGKLISGYSATGDFAHMANDGCTAPDG